MDTYRIQYVDNTYQLVEWDDEQFNSVVQAMMTDYPIVSVNKCVFKLKDIRAIVYIPPVPDEEEQPTDENESSMVITEAGAFNKEVFELMQQLGIDTGAVIGEKGVTKE